MSQSSHREEEDRIPAHVEILSDATSVSSSHHPHPRRDSSLQYSASARGSAIENIYNAYKSHDNYRTKQLGHVKRELWLWDTLAIRGSPPNTSPQELAKRATFMLICMMKLSACIVWAAMFYFFGHPGACCCPITYYLVVSGDMSTLAFEHSGKRDNYKRFVIIQLILILLLPYMVHITIGGLRESGGVLLWSFLSPLGAAFFRSSQESILWYKVFLVCSLSLIGYDYWAQPQQQGHSEHDGSRSDEQLFFWTMNILGVLTIAFAAAVFFAQALEAEFHRSEMLLHNILPPSIAKRLQMGENPIIDKHEQVGLFFADVVGFTKAAATLPAEVVIEKFLQDLFHLTDQAVERRKLTKIKTIGDAYMVVGGIEKKAQKLQEQGDDFGEADPADTVQLIQLARDMFDIVDAVNEKAGTNFEIRVGIHVGPVIAGVLGVKRFAFDVWGDSVNLASRMESHGKPGHVHLTQEAYDKVKNICGDDFEFEWGGEMEIKSKGSMVTFFARPKFVNDVSTSCFFEQAEPHVPPLSPLKTKGKKRMTGLLNRFTSKRTTEKKTR